MRVVAILVAAGSGSRFGADIPKQFQKLAGKSVIRHAADSLASHVAFLQPVGDADAIDHALAGVPHCLPAIPGGETRQDSVRAGLEALATYHPDAVLVHDAARPFIPDGTIPALLAELAETAGAIPAAPVADTLKRVVRGVITETVSREGLFRAQTPQAFRFPLLLQAHRSGLRGATDDASLLEAMGETVGIVPGSENNIKLTYPGDLPRLERVMSRMMVPRVGTGFDVHVFQAGRPLILCGVTIPHDRGLAGHSDADVGIHALCDAIYGALAEGDIGRHFPPSETQWKDADSAAFLRHAAARIAAREGRLVNADITLICERPKITPHAGNMIARLAAILDVDLQRISVKATTTEKLGFTGREEGIAAHAAVSILVPE
jgi:2-C-methyl-D-erythritol 4-phosphate cytidylyltransferase / 2-C-methyl-D-erythritol 2,4-cyclodiphosphate synthase